MTITINETDLILADLPDICIEKRKGEVTYRVTVTIDAAFVSDIINACTIGATAIITENDISYTGTVTGFGCRTGHSIVQITEATVSY
jgi:hypothetical protein